MRSIGLLRVAWQDSRGSRGKLVIFLSGLVLGFACLTFALLVRETVELNLDREARSLLGADLALRAKSPPDAALLTDLQPRRLAREVQTRTMALFPNGVAKLVLLRGIEGLYPFYGAVATRPEAAWQELGRRSRAALVDESLLIQSGAKLGDKLRLGEVDLEIIGVVEQFPGSLSVSNAVAPAIYTTYADVERTGLLGRLSLADFSLFAELSFAAAPKVIQHLRVSLPEGVQLDSVADQRERLGRVNEQLNLFLALVALLCTFLGGLGAGIALFFFLRGKASTFALLRCLGATSRASLGVIGVQVLASAIVALVVGLCLGLGGYFLLLEYVSQSLALKLLSIPIYSVVLRALAVGVVLMLFCSAPGLLALRSTKSFQLLRFGEANISLQQRVAWLIIATFAPFITLHFLGSPPDETLRIGSIVVGVSLILSLCALLFSRAWEFLQRHLSACFVIRHALRRLSRKPASSGVLFVAFVLTGMTISLLLIVRASLLSNVDKVRDENTANLFVYDVGLEDLAGVKNLLIQYQLKVDEDVPIVLMRISKLKGREVSLLLDDPASGVPSWALRREYWTSYRAEQIGNEEIVAGTWTPRSVAGESVKISIEDRLAQRLGVTLGDEIEFSVQGVRIKTTVGSIRKIYWERMRRNAFVIFPEGVLEEAPQFRFLTVHSPDPERTAHFQRALAQAFPGVSAIDLRYAVETVFSLLDQILRAVALLVGLVGLTAFSLVVVMVMSAAAALQKEVALLRTLGATTGQIRGVFVLEQAILFASAVLLVIPLMYAAVKVTARILGRSDLAFPIADLGLQYSLLFVLVLGLALLLAARPTKRGLMYYVRAE